MTIARTIGLILAVPLGLGILQLRPVQAAEPLGRIGIYDLQKIADEIKPGVVVASGKADRQKVSEKELLQAKEAEEKVKKDIQTLAKALERKGLGEQERKKLEKELSEQRKKLGEARFQLAKLAKGKDENRDTFRKEADAALNEYGKEFGFSALFEKSFWSQANQREVVFFNGTVVDVTQEVIERFKTKPPTSVRQSGTHARRQKEAAAKASKDGKSNE